MLIEEISPLAYSATPGIPKEDDVAVIAGFKSLLALAGTGIQGLVQTLAFAATDPGPAAPTKTPRGGATDSIFQPQSKSGGKKGPQPPLDNDVLEDAVCTQPKLKVIVETHRDAMKPLVERLLNAKQVEEKMWAAIDSRGGPEARSSQRLLCFHVKSREAGVIRGMAS